MKNAKGKLIIIGGHEDKGDYEKMDDDALERKNFFMTEGVLKRILTELKGESTRIEVITTASNIPEEVAQMYLDAFKLLNFTNVGILDIRTKEDAIKPEVLQRLRDTDGIMLSGGDQNKLVNTLVGTKALEIMQTRYRDEERFIIAGTSAGAMCMSQVMIQGNIESNPLVKGLVQMGTGLGLTQKVIIDTHIIARSRFSRLVEALAAFPDHFGLGLGEDTALMITANKTLESIGSGLLVILDPRELVANNFGEIINGEHLFLQRMILHILPKGHIFEIDEGVIY